MAPVRLSLLLQVLLLGREIDPDKDKELLPFLQSGQLVKKPPGTPWRDFLKLIQTSRSLFVPNIHDASPRSEKAAGSPMLEATLLFEYITWIYIPWN